MTPNKRCLAVIAGVIAAWVVMFGLARAETLIPHPAGCPARAFCACGASVKVFGKSVRSLWPSSAWLRFPRTSPGHMKVAAKRGHVFVIDYMINATTAMAWDFNSGRRLSRYHARSISGFHIVDPYAGTTASLESRLVFGDSR
jgi:hypothetical protein